MIRNIYGIRQFSVAPSGLGIWGVTINPGLTPGAICLHPFGVL